MISPLQRKMPFSVCLIFGLTLIVAGASFDAHGMDASSTSFYVRQNIAGMANTDYRLNGLVGYWKLDEGSGTTINDSSGHGLGGTKAVSPVWAVGKYGTAVGMNSSFGPNITLTSNIDYSIPVKMGITVSAWVMSTSSQVNNASIFVHTGETTNTQYMLGPDGSSHIVFKVGGTSGTNVTSGAVAGTILTNFLWYHIVGVYDGANTSSIYINGTLIDSVTSNNFPQLFVPVAGVSYIGGNTNGWKGYIDEVRLYRRALSASEIASLYAGGVDIVNENTFSTSTSFKSIGGSGGLAVGTSTSATFGVQSGFFRNLFKPIKPVYEQIHYHWRNDDGSETTATSKTSGIEDSNISSVIKSTPIRLRLEVSNEGGTRTDYAQQQFRLEYGVKTTTCTDIVTWIDVGAVAGDWDMSASANLTEGGDTTNISVGVGGVSDANHTFITPNAGVKDTSSQVASMAVPSDSFTELEYSIEALTAATDGGIYCFRVTNAGSNTNFTYTKYPEATISSGGGSLTFTTDGATESFGNITPGNLYATSSLLNVTTSNTTGFVISLQRGDAVGTMSSSGTYIPDKTDWSNPGATTTPGNATASTTQPSTLQFRVNQTSTDVPNYASAWWGTDDTTANALFGGIPAAQKTIVNRSTAAVTPTVSKVLYNLSVPVTQETGTYSGSITYTATANP